MLEICLLDLKCPGRTTGRCLPEVGIAFVRRTQVISYSQRRQSPANVTEIWNWVFTFGKTTVSESTWRISLHVPCPASREEGCGVDLARCVLSPAQAVRRAGPSSSLPGFAHGDMRPTPGAQRGRTCVRPSGGSPDAAPAAAQTVERSPGPWRGPVCSGKSPGLTLA